MLDCITLEAFRQLRLGHSKVLGNHLRLLTIHRSKVFPTGNQVRPVKPGSCFAVEQYYGPDGMDSCKVQRP